eukprot:CAMPEP_0117034512 /NCGR_PEP_ID=MMETSP0472-20121206/24563_1 /TAXON_ID=693140 ORGANISM="Tiarina fusus, Strain LIS" /NCGR_SAMPLE_ID=MMETSP0472 /ASSEMBLY_ACC=CAM_ASM_000603 /LENGTH=255 /DNA_ID=CAMNT_0004743697 /DNA_START=13 /DNA_END=780 /DNA_ORIENTATION=+
MSGKKRTSKKESMPAHLFPARPKNFRIGGDVRVKKDLSRFVRWPRYIRIQRQRKVLYDRIKVPPSVNQFRSPLDKAESKPFFQLLSKYVPETAEAKKERLEAAAAAGAGAAASGAPPAVLKFGIKHVTTLVEQKKAQLVVIASDVDPIELVVWLPALCRKMDVPYVIVNNKGRLGQLVYPGAKKGKRAAVVALTRVEDADRSILEKLQETARGKFNDNVALRRKWGGGIMGLKTQKKLELRDKALAAEEAKKARF